MMETAEPSDISNTLESIGELAEQAAAEGFYSLQDVGLLIVEALSALPTASVTTGLLTALARLSECFSEYSFGAESAIPDIIGIISHPNLQIALTEDELTALAEQLTTDLTAGAWPIDEEEATPEAAEDGATSSSLSKETMELVELLEMEAALIQRLLCAIDLDTAGATDPLASLADNLERYVNASKMAGFEGLALICEHIGRNVQLCRDQPERFAAPQLQALQDWIANVARYLSGFNETGAGMPMLAQLGHTDWPQPITMEAAAILMALLQATGSDADNSAPAISRIELATPEDVTLALPDDVNHELLAILLQELPVQTQAFSTALQALKTGGSLADLDTAQRIAHNVKGAANTVGIKGVAQLTHYLEDVLVACAEQHTLPEAGLLYTLIEAADCLEAMSESLLGQSPPPDNATAVLQAILDWAKRIELNGLDEIAATAPPPQPLATPAEAAATEVVPTDAADKQQAPMVRIEAEQLEQLFRQAGENIIINSQANERLRRMKNQLQAMQEQFELLRRLGDELEQLTDLKDLSGRSLSPDKPLHDALEMDQYNELHTASRRMVEAAFDAREMNLDASKDLAEMYRLLEDQQRLVTETQETIMAARLVPISSIFHRLQRSLRQTCRLTGKDCELELTGEQMMVDGNTPNAMIDPIMHLLRNAVDHGIEDPQERLSLGKSAQGNITIDFARDGNYIVVRVRDDGRGLDYAAIRQVAEQRGVLSPGQTASEAELQQVILRPNFSTRTEATQTSGRGVGMDVVNYQIQAQGGSLALHSVAGVGLTVEMKIPLPLSRSHALLTHIGPYRIALANKGIRQILFAAPEDFSDSPDGKQLLIEDSLYPVITLNKLLHLPDQRPVGQFHQTALLVQGLQQSWAVMVDSIADGLDIVIKNFGFYIKKIPGFIGATILGDGAVAPVVDLPELLLMADSNADYAAFLNFADPLPLTANLPKVLVVDDSLSQRRALEQLLQDAGYHVQTARDGIEAAEQLDTFTPDIVLTDLEMPRMNGIEFASHIRIRDKFSRLPVIMITSRTTQMHRKMAEAAGISLYLVKPVREDDLLAQMQHLIDSHATA